MKCWVVPSRLIGSDWLKPVNVTREIEQRKARIAKLEQDLADIPKRIASEQREIERLQRELEPFKPFEVLP